MVWKLKFVMDVIFTGKVNSKDECHEEDKISVGTHLCSEPITGGDLPF